MKLHTLTFTPLGGFYIQTHSLSVSGSITLHSPSLLTLQNLHTGPHTLSTSSILKMVSELCAETLEKLQHNAVPTQDLKLHIRQRLWKPMGMMNVIKYFKHFTVCCVQTIKNIKIKYHQWYRYKPYKYFFFFLHFDGLLFTLIQLQ
jgi:hypothetical protein